MEIIKKAVAGTLESSDVYIIVEKNVYNKIEIFLKSTVLDQYENDIRNVIDKTLEEMNVKSVTIYIEDKGALDEVIKSRLQTALMRASENTNYVF